MLIQPLILLTQRQQAPLSLFSLLASTCGVFTVAAISDSICDPCGCNTICHGGPGDQTDVCKSGFLWWEKKKIWWLYFGLQCSSPHAAFNFPAMGSIGEMFLTDLRIFDGKVQIFHHSCFSFLWHKQGSDCSFGESYRVALRTFIP